MSTNATSHARTVKRPSRWSSHRQRWCSIAHLLSIASIGAFIRKTFFMIAEPKPINRTGRRDPLRDPPTRHALTLFAAFKSP